MTHSMLVDLYAEPIQDRLKQLTHHADLVDRTQTELTDAVKAVTDWHHQLGARTTDVTEHWLGTAADRFADRARGAQKTLTTAATALSGADTIVAGALASIRTGHGEVSRLLDEYTGQAQQVVTAAAKLFDAGHPTAMIDAAGYLSKLSANYVTEADATMHTTRQALLTATRQFATLDEHLPAPKHTAKSDPKHPRATDHHTPKHHTPTHHTPTHHSPAQHGHHHGNGGTTAPSSATTVDVGHGVGTVTAPNPRAATAVRAALTQLGVPYVWGGETPGKAFDCSGLTAWAYGKAGISLPHFASSQRIGQKVSEKDLRPGDLVIFSGHVTMYVGHGHVIAAPHTGTDVQIEPLFTSIPGDPFLGFYRPSVHS